MIQLFVEEVSERLLYTLDFVFKERGLEYIVTNDYQSFVDSPYKKLNYSERYFENIVQLVPATLLFDEELIVYGIHSELFEQEECLTFNRVLDPLASIFYILSRMEEYTSTIEDEHGRFQAKNSVMHRFNWLEKAKCDRWALAFLKFLKRHDLINFSKKNSKVKIRPTFDIDNAYAYQYKDGLRRLLSTARDILKRDTIRINERQQVLKGAAMDPYDTYDYILSIADRGFEVNMFWLLGDYSKYDKNLSFKDARHQRLIRKMDRKTTVGIHPSYKSNSYEYYLLNEKERLEVILHRIVEHSRQHFLKLKVSQTYTTLVGMGIKHDFTMGYAENIGFRAGTARPFKWFDLNKNKVTDLTIHPFVYMDGTLNEYMNLDPPAAKEKVQCLYDELNKFGGELVCIWHNETIGNYGKWFGWKEVLEFTLKLNEKENE